MLSLFLSFFRFGGKVHLAIICLSSLVADLLFIQKIVLIALAARDPVCAVLCCAI